MPFQQQPPLLVRWGFYSLPGFSALIGLTEKGELCRLTFAHGRKPAAIMKEWRKEWPHTHFIEDKKTTAKIVQRIAKGNNGVKLFMSGTKFQQAVWKELLKIPAGKTRSYAEIAKRIKNPKAIRAVGTACGANPVPLVVPCHRVIASNGKLGGYGGGLPLKIMLLKTEGALPLKAAV